MNHIASKVGIPLLTGYICLIAFALEPFDVAAQTVGPNVNVSKATGNQYEPAVAIDPKNNNNIFIASRNEIGGLYTARSSDGGVTWTSRLMATNPVPPSGDVPRAYGNASVVWDDFGNLFLAYLSQGSPTA